MFDGASGPQLAPKLFSGPEKNRTGIQRQGVNADEILPVLADENLPVFITQSKPTAPTRSRSFMRYESALRLNTWA